MARRTTRGEVRWRVFRTDVGDWEVEVRQVEDGTDHRIILDSSEARQFCQFLQATLAESTD